MNCKLPTVTISGLALSDLFFNSKLECYDEACASDDTQKISKALQDDAAEFIKDYGLEGQVTPEALVEDFMARV